MKIWRPYTQMLGAHPPFPVAQAEGAYLYLKNGRKILDGISSWWVITHGHSHPAITDAIAKQARVLDQVVFADFSHDSAEELVDLLGTLLPSSFSRAFFSDNGSTSVEVAMKMAYQACMQSGQKGRRKFLTFERAYHGDTCGAMSVTADGLFTAAYDDLRFQTIRCKQGSYLNDSMEEWLGDFIRQMSRYGDQIAAVIIEPLLQGAGGMVVWPIEALQEIERICREQKIFIIFDEVMTGFGRTGSLFAFEKIGRMPDFLCLSKGLTGGALPLAVTLTTDQIYENFLSSNSNRMFFHGHSFTGNAISCAAASANLRLFQSSRVIQQIQSIQRAHHDAISLLRKEIPLKDARVIGPVGIIEVDQEAGYGSHFSKEISARCMDQGLFIRPLGEVIYLMPPYCTTPLEVRFAWETILDVCRKLFFR